MLEYEKVAWRLVVEAARARGVALDDERVGATLLRALAYAGVGMNLRAAVANAVWHEFDRQPLDSERRP